MADKCCVCGKEMSIWSRNISSLMIKDTNRKNHWICRPCYEKTMAHGGLLTWHDDGTATIPFDKPIEIRNKCNVCGHVYCYSLLDLERNKKAAKDALLSSAASLGQTLGGSAAAGAVYSGNAQNSMDKVVDYTRCPKCGSMDVRQLSDEEWESDQAAAQQSSQQTSAADEIKKFKELLDMGAITQEEFDSKKKQLLGL